MFAPTAGPAGQPSGLRVVVTDDDPELLALFSAALRRAGRELVATSALLVAESRQLCRRVMGHDPPRPS